MISAETLGSADGGQPPPCHGGTFTRWGRQRLCRRMIEFWKTKPVDRGRIGSWNGSARSKSRVTWVCTGRAFIAFRREVYCSQEHSAAPILGRRAIKNIPVSSTVPFCRGPANAYRSLTKVS